MLLPALLPLPGLLASLRLLLLPFLLPLKMSCRNQHILANTSHLQTPRIACIDHPHD
jgi:hypothetical protein